MSTKNKRTHPYLGELRRDHDLNQWTGTVPKTKPPVELSMVLDECEDEEALIALAESVVRDLDRWRKRVADFAVKKLLPLKNSTWLEDDEKKVTAKAFRERMKLTSVSIYPDGAFDFMHEDGDLFWGHWIQVTGTVKKGPQDADIPG